MNVFLSLGIFIIAVLWLLVLQYILVPTDRLLQARKSISGYPAYDSCY